MNFRINIYYNEGTTSDGKKYKVPHTTDFGWDMTVSLNGNMKGKVQYDNAAKTYYIIYDARKAGVKLNSNGYFVLHITD